MGEPSLLQQPANPALLKVYAGGALPDLIGGAVSPGQVSLLQTPDQSVKMIEYRGGARKEIEGGQDILRNKKLERGYLYLGNIFGNNEGKEEEGQEEEGQEEEEEEEGGEEEEAGGKQGTGKEGTGNEKGGKEGTGNEKEATGEEEEEEEEEEESLDAGDLDPKKIKFRGVSLKEIQEDELFSQADKFILKIVNNLEDLDKEEKVLDIPVLPVVLYEDPSLNEDPNSNNLQIVTINNKYLKTFIYGVKGEELTHENQEELLKSLEYSSTILFTSSFLEKGDEKNFFLLKNKNEIKEEFIVKDFIKRFKESSSTKFALIKLSNDLFVREIPTDKRKEEQYKKDILSFTFIADEALLFNKILGFSNPYVKEYIKDNLEEFYTFWKTFIVYDATNEFQLMTKKEFTFIQNYLRKLLLLVRNKVKTTALQFLFKQTNPNEVLKRKLESDQEEEISIAFQESSSDSPPDISGARAGASAPGVGASEAGAGASEAGAGASETGAGASEAGAHISSTLPASQPIASRTRLQERERERALKAKKKAKKARKQEDERQEEEEGEEQVEEGEELSQQGEGEEEEGNSNSNTSSEAITIIKRLYDKITTEWQSSKNKADAVKVVLNSLLELDPNDKKSNKDLNFKFNVKREKSLVEQFPKIEDISKDKTITKTQHGLGDKNIISKDIDEIIEYLFRINWSTVYTSTELDEKKKTDITTFFQRFFPKNRETDVRNYLFPNPAEPAPTPPQPAPTPPQPASAPPQPASTPPQPASAPASAQAAPAPTPAQQEARKLGRPKRGQTAQQTSGVSKGGARKRITRRKSTPSKSSSVQSQFRTSRKAHSK